MVEAYAGPALVTCAYIAVYYVMMGMAVKTKTRLAREYNARGEKFDRYFGQDREMLAADRLSLNMLEHMGPFLALLWMHAVFADALSASVAGGIYVVSRLAYPLAMGARIGRDVGKSIMFATGPGYLVLVYLFAGIIYGLAR